MGTSSGDGLFTGQDGYIGVRFNDLTKAGTVYGWIRFEGEASGVAGYVKAWTYRDDGNPIRAGEGQ